MKTILLAPTPPPAGGIAGWTVRMKEAQLKNNWQIVVVDEKVSGNRQMFTLPGKVQTYMAAGKPIVGAINGETALVLNEAQGGYCGEAGNAIQLANNIVKLMHSGNAEMIGKKIANTIGRSFLKKNLLRS